MKSSTLLWFRQDLRLTDHSALFAALERGAPIIPVFIWAPQEEGDWAAGAATCWWLHHSLQSLAQSIINCGSRLIIRNGSDHGSLTQLRILIEETNASAVYWSRRYEPLIIKRDTHIKETLRAEGLEVRSFNAALLTEPWDIQNNSGKPFQVFTPYWKNSAAKLFVPSPVKVPNKWPAPNSWPATENVNALKLTPIVPWAENFKLSWRPGEQGAMENLTLFLSTVAKDYTEGRNIPSIRGTSRLSPHLHFGEISPRQIWHIALMYRGTQFMAELGWREFAHHLLFHFPHTPKEPLRADYNRFPWREDAAQLRAWQRGMTGIPLVDAGMRELWATGWMHNRVRMVVASFLVKNLRINWLHGARWFWDTLVDADLASNTLGWQWSAGCGADAAPYFRVFNPVTQSLKFDPNGLYLRRWLPELAKLSNKEIHAPWECDVATLNKANVRLGAEYPKPIVDLKVSRVAALEAWKTIRQLTK